MSFFTRLILQREHQLARELDSFKNVAPIELGLDCLNISPTASDGLARLHEYVRTNVSSSDSFYTHSKLNGFELSGNRLTFPSPIHTEVPANNVSNWRLFESKQRDKAVLLFPHWNARTNGYDRLSALLKWNGLTVLRMCMPYHEQRNAPGAVCADGMASSNLGRTIRSSRQAVLEGRMAIDWLQDRGYSQIGLIGASLGSSIGFILTAHDPRVQAACFLHLASQFGEVVWTGTATKHIRESLQGKITRDDIRSIWSLISPMTFVPLVADRAIRIQVVSARFDSVFEPPLTHDIVKAITDYGVSNSLKTINCGHHTLGSFPFNLMAAGATIRFFQRAFLSA